MKKLQLVILLNGVPVRSMTSPFRYDAEQQIATNVVGGDLLDSLESDHDRRRLISSDHITAVVTVTDE